ncbi:MAG TPA: pyridoxal-phosphate dependent enzyme, partial [Gemmatimonadales bacterium]|nr:pyridoxal-phosphate dependent enzyme [Gemmatimonadales bacterium]
MHAPQASDVIGARERTGAALPPTPLVRLDHDGPGEIWLKLENLQPIGSFKVRGSGNALLSADPATLAQGVYTASAGNMA